MTLPAGDSSWQWFPLGSHGKLLPGIILTAVITGTVNVSNTYGAVRGTDVFMRSKAPAVRVIAAVLSFPVL